MALDHLLAALSRQAQEERDALLAAARADAARVLGEAAERCAAGRAEALGAQRAELRAALEVEVAEVRRQARREVLHARQRCLDRIFAAARLRLPAAAAGEPYRAALPRLLARALACVGDEPAEIRCPEALGPAVRALASARPGTTVRVEPGALTGIRVVTADGGIDVDGTLDGRLERERPRLSLAVLADLEGGA